VKKAWGARYTKNIAQSEKYSFKLYFSYICIISFGIRQDRQALAKSVTYVTREVNKIGYIHTSEVNKSVLKNRSHTYIQVKLIKAY